MNDDKDWICKVCIPSTYADAYDYALPLEKPPIGSRIRVPFRNKERVGLVLGYEKAQKTYKLLKPIVAEGYEPPLFSQTYLNWCIWLSQYYHSPLSEIISLALPKEMKSWGSVLNLPQDTWIQLHPLAQQAQIPKQQKKVQQLKTILLQQDAIRLSEIKKQGFNQALIDKACALEVCEQFQKTQKIPISEKLQHIALNCDQQKAVDTLNHDDFQVYFLNGVTGSGKTEVYIEAMKPIFAKGHQVLMLVPEIGLTTALYERLQKRLGVEMVMLHSSLTDKTRYQHWLQIYHGKVSLVLGTRSAMFAPLPNLGLIVIDEEHDLSFKQLDGVRYSAKDAAIMRAKMEAIPIVLGSATPCLETYYHVMTGKFKRLNLPVKALNQQDVQYEVMDLRTQKVQHGLTELTLKLIKKHLAQKEQVLIFINRRGYAPLIFCHDCGWSMECPHCDAKMTVHQQKQRLICHYCGQVSVIPKQCPTCFSTAIHPVGVGTEQLFLFLNEQLEGYKGLRFDRDVIKNKQDLEDGLTSIQKHEVDWIVGTQMLAKGHHFSNLGLVVVVDADSGFYQTDFRALERLGQLLVQVSGRTGRVEHIQGKVCIQTHLPTHPLLLSLLQQGYEVFIQELLKQRQEALLPPYSYLALIRVQGKNAYHVQSFLKQLRQICRLENIDVLGPAPAPIERKAGIHRFQLVLKSINRSVLHQQLSIVEEWANQNLPKGLRWFIEVDPYDWSA